MYWLLEKRQILKNFSENFIFKLINYIRKKFSSELIFFRGSHITSRLKWCHLEVMSVYRKYTEDPYVSWSAKQCHCALDETVRKIRKTKNIRMEDGVFSQIWNLAFQFSPAIINIAGKPCITYQIWSTSMF